MTEQRKVRCLDCGYEWSSSASDPRCSKSDCGRSRNVEPVEQADDDPDPEVEDENEPEPEEVEDEVEQVEETVDDDPTEETDDSEGYEPMFKSRKETVGSSSERPESSGDPEVEDDDEEQSDEDDDEQSDDPDEDLPEVNPEELAVIWQTSLSVVDSRMLTDWTIDDDEAEQLGEAWTPVANKYLPYLLKQYTVEGAAVIATLGVLSPKLKAERDARQQAEQEENATDATGGEVREVEVEETDDAPDWSVEDAVEQDAQADDQLGAYAQV